MNRRSMRCLVYIACISYLLCFTSTPAQAQTSAQLREALFAEPDSVLILTALADALDREGFPAAALQVLEEGRRAAAGVSILGLKRAYLLLELRKFAAARDELTGILQTCPTSRDARYALVKLNAAMLDWTSAQAACEELLAVSPDNYFGVLNGAWARFNRRDYAAAYALYAHPQYRHLRVMRLGQAWCKLRLGEAGAARALFLELVAVWPADPDAAAGIAACTGIASGTSGP